MNKLKEKLGPNIKYVFWGVWVVVLLTSTAIWWMATAKLAEDAEKQKTAIKGTYEMLDTVNRTASTQPNPDSHKEMEVRVDLAKQDVLLAWQKQWDYQTQVLVWPGSLNQPGKTDFVDVFQKFMPIETTTEFPMPREVDTTLRKRYKDYIEKQLPGLAEVVGSRWTADFKAATNGGGGMGMMGMGESSMMGMGESSMMGVGGGEGGMTPLSTEPETLVAWSTGSQAELLEQVFPWRMKEVPSTLDVLYSQEDLWVLRNLLQIIATVNGDAKKPFQATIHEIIEIKLGRSVAGRIGQVSKPGAMAGAGMMEGDSSMMMGDSSSMMGDSSSMMMGEGSMAGGGGADVDPAENRYVNTAYEPIAATELRTAMAGTSPENAFLNVAKRLPVKLHLKMDQRKLPELMAACGNARLTVEIRQVRVNTSGGGAASGFGGESSMMMGGESSMMGGESSMMGGMSASTGGASAGDFPFDLPIEVYGVIYIFNPPDLAKLGIDEVDSETPQDVKSVGSAESPETKASATEQEATPETTGTPAPADTDPAAAAAPAAAQPPAAAPATPEPAAAVPAAPQPAAPATP